MIPMARKLLEMNQNVFIASGVDHLNLFRAEVPGLTYIDFPGFKPGYSRHLPQYITLLFKTPLLMFHIAMEHRRLKAIIRDYSIDVVISDNRFGLWNRRVRTAYITHMPRIPFPKPFQFLEFIGVGLHRLIINRYSFCLIPDLPGEKNLTGRLSHGIKLPGNVRYIGILSRFPVKDKPIIGNMAGLPHNTVILSGPEPQKSIFRERILSLFTHSEILTLILEGKPGKGNEIVISGKSAFSNHLQSSEMQQVIRSGEKIITRAGYSTIMELVSLNKSALLVPTPGQTEQEYLAYYLTLKGLFSSCPQKKLKPGLLINNTDAAFPANINEESNALLEKALGELLE
jgi:UDP-N-acetylglucosamine transferase subunit ALG13